jgi:hypothetical protein
MRAAGAPHDLLPWFASGKLRADEAAAFRTHLAGCASCREDLSAVEKLRAEIDEHGAAVLEDHPDADALVGTIRGEVEPGEAARVRRHLALCSTCELEARWVAGEAAIDEPGAVVTPAREARFWVRHAAWGWGLAAAAMLTVAVLVARSGGEPESARSVAMLKPAVVVPTVLAETRKNVFELGPGDAGVVLVLEADLPPSAFPVDVEIVNGAGTTVVRRTGIGRDYLVRELHLLVPCGRAECEAGSYVARIRGAGDELSFAFEIVERP